MQYWWASKCDGASAVRKFVLAAALLIASCGGETQSASWTSIDIQEVSSGQQTTMKDVLDGRPTFVSLWSVTCTPCKRELPWLQKIADDHKDIQVVGIDIGDDLVDIKEFSASLHLTFPNYRDELGGMLAALEVAQVPATFAIDEKGAIVWRHLGALTYEALQNRIDSF